MRWESWRDRIEIRFSLCVHSIVKCLNLICYNLSHNVLGIDYWSGLMSKRASVRLSITIRNILSNDTVREIKVVPTFLGYTAEQHSKLQGKSPNYLKDIMITVCIYINILTVSSSSSMAIARNLSRYLQSNSVVIWYGFFPSQKSRITLLIYTLLNNASFYSFTFSNNLRLRSCTALHGVILKNMGGKVPRSFG